MLRNEAMVLPRDAVMVQEEEMRYVEGGVALNVRRSFLNKSTCKTYGAKYGPQAGLSTMRAAKEIYAHAVAYYASPATLAVYARTASVYLGGIVSQAVALVALNYIRTHANPINLGGDPSLRVKIYNAIWAVL